MIVHVGDNYILENLRMVLQVQMRRYFACSLSLRHHDKCESQPFIEERELSLQMGE